MGKNHRGNLVIKNGRLLLTTGELRVCDILIEKGRIREIGADLRSEIEIDVEQNYVLPGLIDLHTHGIGSERVGWGSLENYARLEAAHGATALYPTLFGAPEEMAQQMIRCLRETDNLRGLPQIRGFRLEAPYLAKTGAGGSRNLAPITQKITDMLFKAGAGCIKIWDISPELPGASHEIDLLSGRGIICSIAHTKASIEQARSAVDAGAKLVTHFFDVFDLPERTEPGVIPPGLVDYLLIEDRVTCEIIDDGTHVHPILVEKALRCKSPERVALITDSNLGAGLPPGRYTVPGLGDVVIRDTNDGVRLVDQEMCLAGSALTPLDSFRNMAKRFGKGIVLASWMSSRTPAHLMGLNAGEIATGRDGDLIVLDLDLNLMHTIIAGEVVYSK